MRRVSSTARRVSLLVAPAITGTRPAGGLDHGRDDLLALPVVQGLRLAGGAAGHQEVDPLGDLPLDQGAERAQVERAVVGERRDQRGAAALEARHRSSPNSMSSTVYTPGRPGQPFRRGERAGGEAVAAPGLVRERHPLVRPVVRHEVGARRGAGPDRRDRERARADRRPAARAWSSRAVPDGASSLAA